MDISETIRQVVARLAEGNHIEIGVVIDEREETGRPFVSVSLTTHEPAPFLIGDHGEHLQALEYVLRVIALKNRTDNPFLALDINGYKKSRTEHAVQLAREAVERVRARGTPEALPPMAPFERREVHTELLQHSGVTTESIGEEPNRRVVIKLLS